MAKVTTHKDSITVYAMTIRPVRTLEDLRRRQARGNLNVHSRLKACTMLAI
jgi:hypothetical protein